MGRQVALLRGINVGRAKRVAMADLRKLVEGLGYTEVGTLLNSGNVVFTVPSKTRSSPGPRIEEALLEELGVASRVCVLTALDLAHILDENPLLHLAEDHSRMLVTVLNRPADKKRLEPLTKEAWKPDAFALGRRVAYQWCEKGLLDCRVAPAVSRVLGRDGGGATSRNWATLLKLRTLVEA